MQFYWILALKINYLDVNNNIYTLCLEKHFASPEYILFS